MKRIMLFLMTNIAIMLVLSITLRLLGVDSILAENGSDLNIQALVILSGVIGFGGAFLGLGMGGKKYRPLEMLGIGLGMLALVFLGKWVLNSPFDPDNKILPTIYFSDHWSSAPN